MIYSSHPPLTQPMMCNKKTFYRLRGEYRGSSHNAVLPQRGFPSYTDVLVLVRGGVRTFYLINSSNTVFLSRLKNQCYRRTPCIWLFVIPWSGMSGIDFFSEGKIKLHQLWSQNFLCLLLEEKELSDAYFFFSTFLKGINHC